MTVTGKVVIPKNPTTLADRIRSSLRGRSLNWLEGAAKLPKGYGSYLANGKRTKINPGMMGRLAIALECDHHWLATGEGDPTQPIAAPVEIRAMHPLDIVLDEPGWPASFGLTFEQGEWVAIQLRARLPKASPLTPVPVWRDERDRLCRVALENAPQASAPAEVATAATQAANTIQPDAQPPGPSDAEERLVERQSYRSSVPAPPAEERVWKTQKDGSRTFVLVESRSPKSSTPPKKPRKRKSG